MSVIKTILFDGITPFNDVPVEDINKAWGDKKHVLVYKDDEFTGIAQPLGTRTLEYWQEHFQAFYDEQEQQEAEAAVQQEESQAQLDRIEANTASLKADIEQSAIDSYTLELMEYGLL